MVAIRSRAPQNGDDLGNNVNVDGVDNCKILYGNLDNIFLVRVRAQATDDVVMTPAMASCSAHASNVDLAVPSHMPPEITDLLVAKVSHFSPLQRCECKDSTCERHMLCDCGNDCVDHILVRVHAAANPDQIWIRLRDCVYHVIDGPLDSSMQQQLRLSDEQTSSMKCLLPWRSQSAVPTKEARQLYTE